MDYRISSFFIRLIRLRKERMTGTIKAATSPPANPLLYRFIPLYTIPTFNATEECRKPATRPAKTPNSPAMGARVVDRCNISQMLSGRGKSNDRKNPPDGRSVQIAAQSQHKTCGEQTVDSHIEKNRIIPVVFPVIRSSDSGAFQDLPIFFQNACLLPCQRKYDHSLWGTRSGQPEILPFRTAENIRSLTPGFSRFSWASSSLTYCRFVYPSAGHGLFSTGS